MNCHSLKFTLVKHLIALSAVSFLIASKPLLAAPTYNLTELSSALVSDDLRLTANGTPFIKNLSFGNFWARDINSSGQMIGSRNSGYGYSGALYQHTPSGEISLVYDFGGGTRGLDINERGDMLIANYDTATNSYNSFRIFSSPLNPADIGQPIYLPIASYSTTAFNNQFQTVGEYAGSAFLFQDNQTYSLQSLIVNAPGFRLASPTDINDAGFITGYGINALGEVKAFLLTPNTTPVPLPATFWLLGAGLIGLVSMACKKSNPACLVG